MQLHPDLVRKTNYRETKVGHHQVHRETLTDDEIDRRIRDILTMRGPLKTNQIMKAVGTFPSHTEVRASLKRIGAKCHSILYWSL
jgi:hypothetical protein